MAASMRSIFVGVGVAVAVWLVVVLVLMAKGSRFAARELLALIPNLVLLFRRLIRDARVPRRTKVALLIAGLWIASPIDLIPEFVPVLGPLDDVVVAALVLRAVLKRTGPTVLFEHWPGDPGTLRRILRILVVDEGGSVPRPDDSPEP